MLTPCPPYPNCVSTESRDPRQHLPAVPFADSPAEAHRRAVAALLAEPRTRITEERPGWLRAEARSRVFRFTDDIEILIDAERRLIRFRSGARIGRNDLGVNRRRMERIAARLNPA